MALKAVLESLDGVPDALHGEYTHDEVTGHYRLNVEDADALVDVSGLKSALKKERDNSKALAAWRKAFPDKTPDEIAELIATAGTGTPPAKTAEDTEKLREKWRADIAAEYAPKLSALEAAQKELRTLKLTDKVRAAAIEGGVDPKRIEDALRLNADAFDLDDQGRVVVLDEDGDPSAITPEKYWAEKEKVRRPYLYAGTGASGSGAPVDKKGGGAAAQDLSKLPPEDRLRLARERGIK
ncbi:MAG: hypothetical protein ACYC1Z_14095 [Georgenia sp.]